MIGLIGKKIGMTQVFDENGKVIPVTLLKVGPNQVVQKKSISKDGYDSIQLGFEEIKEHRLTKPLKGHFEKQKSKQYRYLKEFRLKLYKDIEESEIFDVSMFVPNELIKLTGTSKGKGFAGVMKRYNFAGFESSHGVHESFRGPGSIGQCATPSRVKKGQKLPGRLGNKKTTVINVKVVKVDKEKNLLMVKGAVPGHRNSLVYLSKDI